MACLRVPYFPDPDYTFKTVYRKKYKDNTIWLIKLISNKKCLYKRILMAYSEKVLEHYERPHNVGSLDSGSNRVGTGLVGAPECGDVMKLQIQVDDDNKIIDAKFKTFGCGSAIASRVSLQNGLKVEPLMKQVRYRIQR